MSWSAKSVARAVLQSRALVRTRPGSLPKEQSNTKEHKAKEHKERAKGRKSRKEPEEPGEPGDCGRVGRVGRAGECGKVRKSSEELEELEDWKSRLLSGWFVTIIGPCFSDSNEILSRLA